MTVPPPPGQIRALVERKFEQLGEATLNEQPMEETLLVQNGRCMARSYRTSRFFAMWLVELGLVQFYDADGDMLCVINLLQEFVPRRIAA